MKKLLAVLMAAVMCVSFTACSGGSGAASGSAQKSESSAEPAEEPKEETIVDRRPDAAGKWRWTTLVTKDEGDISEALAALWESKDMYVYYEITPEGKMTQFIYNADEEEPLEEVMSVYLNPELTMFYALENLSDEGAPITFEGNTLKIEFEDEGMKVVAEKTDEIPD